MATPPVPDALLQQAVDLVALYGSTHSAFKVTGIASGTLANRCTRAAHRGIVPGGVAGVPTVAAAATYQAVRPKVAGRSHLVIPDVQAKPEAPNDHLEWIANYAIEHRPDVVIQIGDWGDMPSLSMYDKGKRSAEGRRYVDDIDATRASVERFERPIDDYNRTHADDPFNPEKKFLYGNHEQRVVRAGDLDPAMHGKLSLDDFGFEDYGWETHPFLEVVKIDGIEYSHYFTSGDKGLPVSSAAALLALRQGSATMGHVQRTDIAMHKKTQRIGLFCGICYLHDEKYLGPQGNGTRRQIVMKREVADGKYDLEFISLEQLRKRYS